MKKSTIKRTLCSLMAVITVTVSMSLPVCAASVVPDETPTTSCGTVISPIYNSTPGFNAGYISGGYGEIPVSIEKYVSTGYFQAAVSSNNNSGTIRVSVRYPNGSYAVLGSMPASGGHTTLMQVYGLSAGTYTFIFEPSSLATFNVMGYIYE